MKPRITRQTALAGLSLTLGLLVCVLPAQSLDTATAESGGHEWLSPVDPWSVQGVLRHELNPPARKLPAWQVVQTPNFRILHLNKRLAAKVAKLAETWRSKLFRAWAGRKFAVSWKQPCDLYLYPSYQEMIFMTGGEQKAGSTVVRPSKLYPGKILSRRVNLFADDHGLLKATLPHEVTHLVMGDLFAGNLALWANEGTATVAEEKRKQAHYLRILRRFAAHNRIFPEQSLMTMQRYPDGASRSLFYAQAHTLVRFFIDQGGRQEFLRFLRHAASYGYENALRYVYEIDGFSDLRRLWWAFATTG